MPNSSLIRDVMRERGLTYRDAEFLTGLSASYLNRVVKGRRHPSPQTVLALAKALGLTPKQVTAALAEQSDSAA